MDRALRRARITLVAAVALVVAGFGGSAQAASIHIEFNDVVTSLGPLTNRVLIAPGDPPGTADGDYDPATGAVNIPADGWKMPKSKAFEGLPGINVATEFKANGPVTGTYDTTTGALSLKVDNSVTTFLSGALTASCTIPSAIVDLATSNTFTTFTGAPFLPAGALVASWPSLPAATTGDAGCISAVNAVAGANPGGIRQAGTVTISDQPAATAPSSGGGPTTTAPSTSGSSGAKFGPRVGPSLAADGKARSGGYTFSGKLTLPQGVRPVDGCAGAIGVQIKAGKNTISYTTTRVEDDCTFKHGVDMSSRRTRGEKVRAIIRFNGNQALLPKKLDSMALGTSGAKKRAHTRGRLRLRARIASRAKGTMHAPAASLLTPGARQVGGLARAALSGM